MATICRRLLLSSLLVIIVATLGGGASAQDAVKWTPVTDERLLNAAKDPNNWLKSLGELGEQQSFPMVNDGVMIVTAANIPHNTVYALDAVAGRQLWKWTRKTPEDLTAFARIHPQSRGVALYENTVIIPT